VSDVEVRGVGRVELEIWDTAGQEDYDSLRSLSYPDSHALVLCFSIGDPPSYCNVFEKVCPMMLHTGRVSVTDICPSGYRRLRDSVQQPQSLSLHASRTCVSITRLLEGSKGPDSFP